MSEFKNFLIFLLNSLSTLTKVLLQVPDSVPHAQLCYLVIFEYLLVELHHLPAELFLNLKHHLSMKVLLHLEHLINIQVEYLADDLQLIRELYIHLVHHLVQIGFLDERW